MEKFQSEKTDSSKITEGMNPNGINRFHCSGLPDSAVVGLHRSYKMDTEVITKIIDQRISSEV